MNTNTWYRWLGVRPNESRVVGLLLLHGGLLSLGTLLTYAAASAVLLAHNPVRSLPLAYCAAALAMLAVGRGYAHYEQHWLLQRLAPRLLLAGLVLAGSLGVLALTGPSLGGAVAIMVGYRLIYLLTALATRDAAAGRLSARQGRRLAAATGAADLPAKVLGAGGAILAPQRPELLLLAAFAAYLLALVLGRAALPVPEQLPPAPAAPARRGRALTLYLGLSLTAVSVGAVGVEYLFFTGVAGQLKNSGPILQYVGGMLALTYLLALAFRLLAARHGFDRLALRRTLLGLPLAALAGVVAAGVLPLAGTGARLTYFAGLYLGLEVLRRALFEPALLGLLQPLPPQARRQAYTQLVTRYAPLGLGLGGLLLLALPPSAGGPHWEPLVWIGGALVVALGLLRGAYQQYLRELKKVLGLRLGGAGLPEEAPPPALGALLHLHRADAPALLRHAEALLRHPQSQVRRRTLALVGSRVAAAVLRQLALEDSDPTVRQLAGRFAGRHAENTDLLTHPDITVRKGALRGRLETAPADAAAQAGLAALVADEAHHLAALELVRFLTPAQQAACIVRGLGSAEPTLVRAAITAAAAVAPDVLVGPLLGLLPHKTTRKAAMDSLVQLGNGLLPLLQEILARETDERLVRCLTQVCVRLGTPASRQLLVLLAQDVNLCSRAAALRGLSSLPAVPTEAPLFQKLVEEELRLAQHLLHGMQTANAELRTALRYELRRLRQRLLGLLLQLYAQPPLLAAQRTLAHATGERQATALEPLDQLIPRPLYLGLQALLDEGRLREKVLLLADLLGPAVPPEPVLTTIVRRGTAAFTAWTVGVALRQWHPTPDTVAHLYPHLQTSHPLLQESAREVLRRLPTQRPAAYDQLLLLYPTLTTLAMPSPGSNFSVSFLARVRLLKSTALFGQTPENVLTTIVPIMHEVSFGPDEQIFAQGTLGTSLFIICEGEVGIFNRRQLLTTFGPGEFFGELALLDAEPRSAAAVALQAVRAFRIDQEDFYDVTEECTEVVRSIMRELCQRLRRQNERMAQPADEAALHSA